MLTSYSDFFYTTRTFNHETTCTQLQWSPVGTLFAPLRVCRLCWGAGLSQAAVVPTIFRKQWQLWPPGPPEPLGVEWVEMTVVGLGWQKQVRISEEDTSPAPISISSFALPRPKCRGGGVENGPYLLYAGNCHLCFAAETCITGSPT